MLTPVIKVSASGVWDQKKEFLLDNRVLDSRPGYHVITPLVLRDGKSAVLINRGWVPAFADRTQVPKIPVAEGSSDVTGIAVVPQAEHFLLKNPEPIGEYWQPVWQALDLNRFREAVDYRMHDFVIVLQSGHKDGFEYDWKMPSDDWIVRHNAYAFQWFALAATLLVIYFVANLRRRSRRATDAQAD